MCDFTARWTVSESCAEYTRLQVYGTNIARGKVHSHPRAPRSPGYWIKTSTQRLRHSKAPCKSLLAAFTIHSKLNAPARGQQNGHNVHGMYAIFHTRTRSQRTESARDTKIRRALKRTTETCARSANDDAPERVLIGQTQKYSLVGKYANLSLTAQSVPASASVKKNTIGDKNGPRTK